MVCATDVKLGVVSICAVLFLLDQVLLDVGRYFDWVNSGVVEPYFLTVAGHQELCEIPRDLPHNVFLGVIEDRVPSEVLEHIVSIFSVDIGAFHHVELDAKLGSCQLDFLYVVVLLSSELVGGEGQNLQAITVVLVVYLNHLLIVRGSEPSLGCDVDNQVYLRALGQLSYGRFRSV